MEGVEFVITYTGDPDRKPIAYFAKLTDAQRRAREYARRGGAYQVRSMVDGKVKADVISLHRKFDAPGRV